MQVWIITSLRHADPPPPSKVAISVFFIQKVTQCSKTNEMTIFLFLRFLVFEIWSIH